jgi:hypothetical protein
MNGLCTLGKALEYAAEDNIEEWIHLFLHDEGDNVVFSDGLKLEKRFFVGPIKMPLNLFERCCGPEDSMRYQIDAGGFDWRVNEIQKRFKDKWDMPPLIINYCEDKFELNDGNHRYEALKRSGVQEYHVIIWITEDRDYQSFSSKYGCLYSS